MTVHIQEKEFWVLSDFYYIEIADSGKQNKQQLIKEEIFQATWDREAQWGVIIPPCIINTVLVTNAKQHHTVCYEEN